MKQIYTMFLSRTLNFNKKPTIEIAGLCTIILSGNKYFIKNRAIKSPDKNTGA
jgi:hypothetical protein